MTRIDKIVSPESLERLQTLFENKVDHVRKAKQSRNHTCHWPACNKQVPPAMFMCKPHWFSLPKSFQSEIWKAYRPGQEDRMDPTDEYLKVANKVINWCKEQGK